MTDYTTQGVSLSLGDGGGPEVFTAIGDITNAGDIGAQRSKLDNTKLSGGVKTSKPGLIEIPDLTVELTYDPDDTLVASLWTKVTTEDQVDSNWKLDLDVPTPEVWSFAGYVQSFMLIGLTVDGLIKARVVLSINTVITIGAT